MNIVKKSATAKEVLESFGATNIEGYCLISNFGYTFELDGKRYDARFWANSYGCAINLWDVMSLNEREDGFYEPVDPELHEKLNEALNACGER